MLKIAICDDEKKYCEEMQEKILTMKGYTRDYEEN